MDRVEFTMSLSLEDAINLLAAGVSREAPKGTATNGNGVEMSPYEVYLNAYTGVRSRHGLADNKGASAEAMVAAALAAHDARADTGPRSLCDFTVSLNRMLERPEDRAARDAAPEANAD